MFIESRSVILRFSVMALIRGFSPVSDPWIGVYLVNLLFVRTVDQHTLGAAVAAKFAYAIHMRTRMHQWRA